MYPTKPLGEILEKITDGTHQTPTYFEKGVIFLSSKNVTTGKINWENVKYIDEKQHIEMSKRITPKKGDILLAKNGTTGIGAMVDKDEIFDIYVSLALLRPTDKIFSKFLWYYINSSLAKKQFNSKLKGAGVPNLHLKEIKEVKIPLPPLPTQQKIVEKLDKIFAKIDKNISLTKQNIANIEEENNAILEKIFTECEEEFGVEKLGEKIILNYGKSAEKSENGIFDVYGANGIMYKSEKFLFDGKSIIIGRKGSAGALNKVNGKFWASDVTYFVTSNENIDYIFYVLKFLNLPLLARGVKPGINRNDVYALQIPLPPLLKQQEIVTYLDNIFAKNSELKNFYEKNLKNLEELRQSILKQAFEDENFIK